MASKDLLPVVGLTALVAFVVGGLMGRGGPSSGGLPIARAMSAQADESFAVCTTTMDGVNEGFFMLDFETGDLTGGVLNPNSTKFTVSYRHNVLKDLGFKPGQVKTPRFLMVPGRMAFTGNAGTRAAQSVIYVTDASTGVTVAYGIPWAAQQSVGGRGGIAELTPLDIARPRGGVAP